jgi:uncharacterized protein (DUF58 family)
MNLRLNKILIKTKKQVFSDISGDNISPLKGDGYDFAELREYEVGDDVKNIDWAISAKMHKPYIKVFHAQRKLNIAVASLLGGSTYFGSNDVFKNELIANIVAILGYSTLKQNDNFFSLIASDATRIINQKFNTKNSIQKAVEAIYEFNPIGQSINYDAMFRDMTKLLKKRTILFLVGDFVDVQNHYKSLRLLSKKYELIAIIVRDKFEEEPKSLGSISLNDPTTHQRFEGNIDDKSLENYAKNLKIKDKALYKEFHKNQIRYTKIYTDEDPFIKLMKLFKS